MHQPPLLLRQAASNAPRISGAAFSRSAAETTRTSRSPVPRCPIPRMSRVKPSSNSTESGSSLSYTRIASCFGRKITDATFTNRR